MKIETTSVANRPLQDKEISASSKGVLSILSYVHPECLDKRDFSKYFIEDERVIRKALMELVDNGYASRLSDSYGVTEKYFLLEDNWE